ncbi:MAG TPA: hypothetical protein VFA21_04125 [Pyrinomonadaceae bacterium]|jgi:hypothetical protein|nr:hypothetical protein [Pyrinomonadaceae bacterium]
MTIGGGERSNYPGLILFLAGLVVGAFAIYGGATGTTSGPQTAGAIILTAAGCALIAARKDEAK